jgi:hypothetical protein
MQITQSNHDGDTATFHRPDPPLVKGGQGRDADSITDTVTVCGWLMLAVIEIGAVVCGLGIVQIVAGWLVASIAALCCVVVGWVCYEAGRAVQS